MLGFLGLEARHITEESGILLEAEIDYGQSEERLQEYRQQSVDFLLKGIEQ